MSGRLTSAKVCCTGARLLSSAIPFAAASPAGGPSTAPTTNGAAMFSTAPICCTSGAAFFETRFDAPGTCANGATVTVSTASRIFVKKLMAPAPAPSAGEDELGHHRLEHDVRAAGDIEHCQRLGLARHVPQLGEIDRVQALREQVGHVIAGGDLAVVGVVLRAQVGRS